METGGVGWVYENWKPYSVGHRGDVLQLRIHVQKKADALRVQSEEAPVDAARHWKRCTGGLREQRVEQQKLTTRF